VNWDALGAIGQLVAAVAVVATLLYVSRQLREQTRALNTTVRDSVFHQLQEWNYQVVADRHLADLFQRGAASADWSEIDHVDQARLIHVFYSFFKVFENIYLHAAEGSTSPAVWERNCQVFFAYAAQSGCRRYWEQRRATLDSRFVAVLETIDSPQVLPGFRLTDRG
jgi:hypothetical protein